MAALEVGDVVEYHGKRQNVPQGAIGVVTGQYGYEKTVTVCWITTSGCGWPYWFPDTLIKIGEVEP